jgi:asparagine synthase (glutamine-hydrolysing)
MGAIVAILGEANDPELGEGLQRMLTRSSHRGEPESLVEGPLAIGIQSLGSDASLAQHGNWMVAFHGYIGNWAELAAERGWKFESGVSNAGKIAVAYEDLGEQLFTKLRGEWAVLIWDRRERTLLAARDVIGCRPLFVHRYGGCLFLATELRQALAGSGAQTDIDIETFRRFLQVEPNPDGSSVRGVSQVAAGSVWDSKADRRGRPSRTYFRFGRKWRELARAGLDEAAEIVRERLETAVAGSSADLPMCVALSGGLDSSAVWGIVSQTGSAEIRPPGSVALCLRFPNREDDEGEYMDAVLERWPGPRTDIQLNSDMVLPRLEEAASLADTPYLANIVSQLELARTAGAEGRRMVLTGHGGDLVFHGNLLDLEHAVFDRCDLMAAWWAVRLAVGQRMVGEASRRLIRRLGRRFMDSSPPSGGIGAVAASGHSASMVDALWEGDEDSLVEAGRCSMLHEVAVEQAGWVLTPWEQVSAAFGVEIRHPLLDLDLVEAALAVRQKLHLARGYRKGLLRVAALPYLPGKVRSRRGKMSMSGFIVDGLKPITAERSIEKKGSSDDLEEIVAGFDDEVVLPMRLLVADLCGRGFSS